MSILLPPIAFILFLGLAFLFGLGALKFAPKMKTSDEAKTSYAGGEDVPATKRFPGYKIFYPIALFFTILHVMALFLGLLPQGAAVAGLSYIAVVIFALVMIIVR